MVKCAACKAKLSGFYECSHPQFDCPKCKKSYCDYCVKSQNRRPGIKEISCPKGHLVKTVYIDPSSRREVSREKFEEKMGYS